MSNRSPRKKAKKTTKMSKHNVHTSSRGTAVHYFSFNTKFVLIFFELIGTPFVYYLLTHRHIINI